MSAAPNTPAGRRQWADFIAILTGMSLIGFALWGGPMRGPNPTGEMRNLAVVALIYFVTGALAVVCVGLAQSMRWQRTARIGLVVVGVLLLCGLVAFRDLGWRAWTTIVIPAVLLLATSRLVGPIPLPPPASDDPARRVPPQHTGRA